MSPVKFEQRACSFPFTMRIKLGVPQFCSKSLPSLAPSRFSRDEHSDLDGECQTIYVPLGKSRWGHHPITAPLETCFCWMAPTSTTRWSKMAGAGGIGNMRQIIPLTLLM